VIDVAEGFQSRQRHMEELILSPLISYNKTPASTIKIEKETDDKLITKICSLATSLLH
jgi:hypothetical protein